MSIYHGIDSNTHLAQYLKGVLNMEVLQGAFYQQKALLEAFSVIVKTLPMALYLDIIIVYARSTNQV